MATTTVTGPDGKDYEVTHPDGASEADILAYAKQNYGGQAEATPSGGFFDTIRRAKAESERIIGETGARKSVLGPLITSMIPETPGQAVATGLMAATAPFTGGLSATPVLGRATGPALRTALGAVSGAAGTLTDKGDPSEGALTGGLVTAGIETALPVGGKIISSLPGMKQKIANDTAKKVLEWIKTVSGYRPPATGALTGATLNPSQQLYLSTRAKAGGMNEHIQQRFGQAINDIDQMISANLNPTQIVNTPAGTNLMRNPLRVPSLGGYTNIRDAEDKLALMLEKAHQVTDPVLRKASMQQAAEHAAVVRQEIEDAIRELGRTQSIPSAVASQAGSLWRTSRDMYGRVKALGDLLHKSNIFSNNPQSVMLNERNLQRAVGEKYGSLEGRMKGAERPLAQSVLRGGELGSADFPASGTGEALSSLMQVLRGSNLGASRSVQLPVTTALPNVGSQFVGRPPFAPSDELKMLLDILGISATTGGTP